MATTMKRFMLSLPPDVAERAEDAKKDIFYNKSYAELYRHLIALGLDTLEKKTAGQKNVSEKVS